MADLTTQLCGLTLKNPVIASSGTFGYGIELESILDLNAIGGFVVKGLSREPIAGNAALRILSSIQPCSRGEIYRQPLSSTS